MNAISTPPNLDAPNLDMPNLDVLASEQILLNRVAQLERRLQVLADRLASADDGQAGDLGLPKFLEIDAESQIELANGFYLREWDGDGNPFRWAGRAEYFEFRFFLDRRSTLPFAMRGILARGIANDAIHAFVDYRPVPVRVTHDGAMVEIEGRIPADPLGHGVTLTFLCPSVSAPVAEDARRLSFAFCRLAVGEAKAAAPVARPQRRRSA